MRRMSGPAAERLRLQFLKSQAGRCANQIKRSFKNARCYIRITESTARLDHIDNNPANNVRQNLQDLCPSCNSKKNPRGASRRGERARDHKKLLYERERAREKGRRAESEPESDRMIVRTAEMAKSLECEPKFRTWIEGILLKVSTISVEDVVNGGAEFVGCSQQTIRRYLDKISSFIGEYEYFFDEAGKRFLRFRDGTEGARKALLNKQAANWRAE